MINNQYLLCLDIGEVRIGVAVADAAIKIATPLRTILMNEITFADDIKKLIVETSSNVVIVGFPRNQSGEPTAQTAYVEKMALLLAEQGIKIVFQDESLTTVIATERLNARGSNYQKADIDAEAAALILQDYLESQYR